MVWRGLFLFLLFFTYVSCFVGLEFGITDFQMVEVFFRFCDYNAGESQEGNEVRNRHEAIYYVGEGPYFFKLEECTACNDNDVDNAVDGNGFDACCRKG